MKQTAFKPGLKNFGQRKKIWLRIRPFFFILIIICFLTPFTNWVIPIVNNWKIFQFSLGSIFFILENEKLINLLIKFENWLDNAKQIKEKINGKHRLFK